MFLEVVTRSHPRRPTLLERCQASLDNQSDSDWEQSLLIDEKGRGVQWANYALASYVDELTGQYIWVLDDDDVCFHAGLVADLKLIHANADPDVIMMRCRHVNHGIIPEDQYWENGEAKFGHVAMPCFVVRRQVYMRHSHCFRFAFGADYHFIKQVLADDAVSVYWHNVIAAEVDRQSFGAPE